MEVVNIEQDMVEEDEVHKLVASLNVGLEEALMMAVGMLVVSLMMAFDQEVVHWVVVVHKLLIYAIVVQ
jgi:hypothetical protein